MSMSESNHPRIVALLDMFRKADALLRELPLYNGAISIEAIGFREFGDDAMIGVVLTPWFMNLVRLPVMRRPYDGNALGQAVRVVLPFGERRFTINGDENVGLFEAHSLHSPVLGFCAQEHARAEAMSQLAMLLSPPVPEEEAAAPVERAKTPLARRALIFGPSRNPA